MLVNVGEALERAKGYIEKGEQLDVANSLLNQLLDLSFHHAGITRFHVLYLLGVLHMKMNCNQAAVIFYKAALDEEQDFVEARNNVACIYRKEGFRKEAEKEFGIVLETVKKLKAILTPKEESDYLTNYASCLVQNGTPQKAIDMLNKALALTPDETKIIWNRSLAYLELGDYERGFRDYDSDDRSARNKNRRYTKDETPDWDGTPGKVVVVYGEQGIGDELMFASMLPDLIKDCKQVIIDAHLRLVNIFRASFPGIVIYGSREQDLLPWHRYHAIDAKVPMGSLGKFYRKKESDFPKVPYLVASENIESEYFDEFRNLPDKPLIGFSWKGGVKSTSLDRLIPLDEWKEIFKLDANFISLQYDSGAEHSLKKFCEKNNIKNVYHWKKILDDYDLTSALVSHLDLIISVPQSVVHLAGGLGVSVWQLCPKRAMWQMGPYGKDMPWYGSVYNIWQEKIEDWTIVMKKVKEKLCSLLAMSTKH